MTGDVIRTAGLCKRYPAVTALQDLDLQVAAGEVFGYLGPNGAGKTTTLRLLMGLLRPSGGTAEILGLDCWRQASTVHPQVGYVPGDPALYPRMTGAQHVTYLRHLRGDGQGHHAAALAGRLDLDLARPAHALSKGNRQKLAIVLALMSRPQLLILDEPTTGLDPLVQQEFIALIREHTATGGSVLLSSHVLGEVQRVADRIGVLRAGRLVAVERLDEMRAKSLHHIKVSFGHDVDASMLAALPGVRDLTVTGRSISCGAPQSALDALLKLVSRHDVLDFECTEAELEETFLAYYGSRAVAEQDAEDRHRTLAGTPGGE